MGSSLSDSFHFPSLAMDLVQLHQLRQKRLGVLRQQLGEVDKQQTQLERKGVELEQHLRSKV